MKLIPDIVLKMPYQGKELIADGDAIELNPKSAYTIFNNKCYLLPTTDLIIKNALTGEQYFIESLPEVKP